MKIKLLTAVALTFTLTLASESASADDLIESEVVGIKVAGQVLAGIGGGAPWVVAEGTVKISESDGFEVEVEGLLLLDGTVGPVIDVIASLHCLGDTGYTEVARIGPAPLSFDGNVEMERQVGLPPLCIAPVVLVRVFSIDGSFIGLTGTIVLEDIGVVPPWIAASGFKSGD